MRLDAHVARHVCAIVVQAVMTPSATEDDASAKHKLNMHPLKTNLLTLTSLRMPVSAPVEDYGSSVEDNELSLIRKMTKLVSHRTLANQRTHE